MRTLEHLGGTRRLTLGPYTDNVATPLAAALGDLVTLVILGILSSLFILFMGTIVSSLVFLALLGAIAANIVFVFRNAYVQELLTMGWGPLFAAMAISRYARDPHSALALPETKGPPSER